MTTWLPIATAPRDGTVIVIRDDIRSMAAYFDPSNTVWPWRTFDPTEEAHTNGYREKYVLGWQPLPPPPTDGE